MSNILVQCKICKQVVKEMDTIHDSEEGYICYSCINERNERITTSKRSLDKWV